MRPTLLALAATLAAAPVGALEPLNLPTPLTAPATGESPGEEALEVASALRAQALGFPSTAAALYRSMLAKPGADAARLNLGLATALLDEGDIAGAAKALDAIGPPHDAAWHLRKGLIAAYSGRHGEATGELAATRAGELSAADRGWAFFLQGMLAAGSKEPGRAPGFYQQAVGSAVSVLERARFLLAEEEARLRVGSPNEAQLANDRLNADNFRGQAIGYSFAREYAVALNAARRKRQAVEVIEAQIQDIDALPGRLQERMRGEADHFRLLVGLIAGAEEGVGRRELFQLVASGSDADRQRVALLLLFRSSDAGVARSELRQRLDEFIAAPRSHPIMDALLLCRAHVALGDKEYAQAEESAHKLLEQFPGAPSPIKANAFAVLAGSAWEQGRYRTAADYAGRAVAVVPEGAPVRAEFGLLVAEAWFRAGRRGDDREDFRNAADAYAAALRNPPVGVAPGVLMFQRVEAEVEAGASAAHPGDLARAASVLDELARDPRFDAQNRWKAEWNLSRELEVEGEAAEAYARVNKLLASPESSRLPGELRANMAWLQARLSFDERDYGETLRLLDSLEGSLGGLPAALKTEIDSTGMLLRAEAGFAQGQEGAALAALKRLRDAYPRADAAVYSYIVEANHYAAQDKVAEAQGLLTRLAEEFPQSRYAPYALYQAALQAERLGQDKNLREAYKLLESIVTDPRYRSGDLAFYARMRQGDLLEKLNQFPQAQQCYQFLVDDPRTRNPDDVILARLALAECHDAQAAGDPTHAKKAVDLFEDLLERVDASPDVRVEAGYNLGGLLKRQGDARKAQEVWWSGVVDPFLIKPGGAEKLGAKGRHWMELTLLQGGDLYEEQGRMEEAKRAWLLILQTGLPGTDLARDRLKRFNLPAARQ